MSCADDNNDETISKQQQTKQKWDASIVSVVDYEHRVEPLTGSFVDEMMQPFLHDNNSCTSQSLLDVGCGTGIASLIAYRKGFQVTSTDMSQDMVDRCHERLLEEEEKQLRRKQKNGEILPSGSSFQCFVADGQNLSNEQNGRWLNRFDFVIGNFSIIFFPDILQGLKEIYHCLKPGTGQVVLSAWGNQEETPAFQVFPDALRDVFGKSWTSNRITGSVKLLQSLLQDAGFEKIRIVGPIQRMLCVPSAEAYYDRFALTSPNIKKIISSLASEDEVQKLRTRVMELAIERGRGKKQQQQQQQQQPMQEDVNHEDKGDQSKTIQIPSMAYIAYGTKPVSSIKKK